MSSEQVSSETVVVQDQTAPGSVAVLQMRKGQALEAIRGLLRALLAGGCVEAVLVPVSGSSGGTVAALIRDPSMLEEAMPLALTMPISLARILGGMSAAPGTRVGVVVKPCEARALVELAKLRQVEMGRLLVLAVDCLGTYSVTEHKRLEQECPGALEAALSRAARGEVTPEPGFAFRPACQICDRLLASQLSDGWDVAIGLVGNAGAGVQVTFASESIELLGGVADSLGLDRTTEVPTWSGRDEFLSIRAEHRRAALDQLATEPSDLSKLAATLTACVRCGNCSVACPMCFCKECLFRTPAFVRTLDDYVRVAARKGATRLLADTALFHLTRMSHVAASCVSCGMCEAACPNGVPLSPLFAAVARRVQATFAYEPGRSREEPLPLATFQEHETTDLGDIR